jgi:hypothetical protein
MPSERSYISSLFYEDINSIIRGSTFMTASKIKLLPEGPISKCPYTGNEGFNIGIWGGRA